MGQVLERELQALARTIEAEVAEVVAKHDRPGAIRTAAMDRVMVRMLLHMCRIDRDHGWNGELVRTLRAGVLQSLDAAWTAATGEPCLIVSDVDKAQAAMQAVRAGLSPETVRGMDLAALSESDIALILAGLAVRKQNATAAVDAEQSPEVTVISATPGIERQGVGPFGIVYSAVRIGHGPKTVLRCVRTITAYDGRQVDCSVDVESAPGITLMRALLKHGGKLSAHQLQQLFPKNGLRNNSRETAVRAVKTKLETLRLRYANGEIFDDI